MPPLFRWHPLYGFYAQQMLNGIPHETLFYRVPRQGTCNVTSRRGCHELQRQAVPDGAEHPSVRGGILPLVYVMSKPAAYGRGPLRVTLTYGMGSLLYLKRAAWSGPIVWLCPCNRTGPRSGPVLLKKAGACVLKLDLVPAERNVIDYTGRSGSPTSWKDGIAPSASPCFLLGRG